VFDGEKVLLKFNHLSEINDFAELSDGDFPLLVPSKELGGPPKAPRDDLRGEEVRLLVRLLQNGALNGKIRVGHFTGKMICGHMTGHMTVI